MTRYYLAEKGVPIINPLAKLGESDVVQGVIRDISKDLVEMAYCENEVVGIF